MTESSSQQSDHPDPGLAPANATAANPEMLKAPGVDPLVGLTQTQVEARRKEHGYNEVAEQKEHPLRRFMGKFWGVSAWMLELILILSAVLRKYSDLVVVATLLIFNAALSYWQEHRAAGVVEALRRRLRVNARVLREAGWQSLPARELVPGDVVRMRAGDIIPADVRLLDGPLDLAPKFRSS